jgi:adenylylsulfate kinase
MIPMTFWFTGLSSSGKTTLAFELQSMFSVGSIIVLDGDILRQIVTQDLGYTHEDRLKNIKRAAGIAKILNDQGLVVISSFITPSNETREVARQIVGPDKFDLIYLKCDLEICRSRDVKGLYKAKTKRMTGVSQSFDDPTETANLIVDTGKISLQTCSSILTTYIKMKSGVN